MYEPRFYDSPPVYSPPFSTTSHSFYPPRSIHSPYSQRTPHTYSHPPQSYYVEGKPQPFHRWFSPPGLVKTFKGTTVLMCFLIFAFVASTLVWDVNGFGYGGYAAGDASSGASSGYYGGSYGYSSSYMTPQSAKAAMISMAAINFLVSLGFLVGSFSRARVVRGGRFYLSIFICDIILAVLQGIIDIIFVIGVNPMSQSSQSMLYNPMLMMCQSIQSTPSISGSAGAGFPGGFPMYNQYLHHYCYMDPEEAVAFVLGLMVVLVMSFSAYYAYKTRSKIYRHGKDNIYWDQPLGGASGLQGAPDWLSGADGGGGGVSVSGGGGVSSQRAPTVVVSERVAAASDLRTENSTVSHGNGALSIHRSIPVKTNKSCGNEPVCRESSSSDELLTFRNPPPHVRRTWRRDRPPPAESQYETGYTTGDTGNELENDCKDHLFRVYPEIISDEQRRVYKKEFDSELLRYKSLCAHMDHISDRLHALNRDLDTMDSDSAQYQGVAAEYNRLKELKRTADYQDRKKQSKELRQKLFHIKRLVKVYDQGLC